MEDIVNLIATDGSPSEISDSIKNALFAKSAEKIEFLRPSAADSLFDMEDHENNDDEE